MSRGFPLRKAADGDTFAPSALFPGNVTGPGRYDGRERGERMAALRERGGRTAWPGQTVAAGLGMLGAVFLLPLLFLPPSDSPPSRASQPAEVLPVPTVTRPEPTPVPGWDDTRSTRPARSRPCNAMPCRGSGETVMESGSHAAPALGKHLTD